LSQVLYRKYRSQDLSDVVGQPHITTTLEAAIKKGRIAHAYLLCGPRGTGKTSVARILARRINELPADTDMSRYMDIVEIDAASNRGIDEIRTLREGIGSASSQLRYKVYIIDEVHMLTREAFNALLKTLEEPPEHVVFVLATTEAHKLPETIISRTQRFDFRAITISDLVAHLRTIADAEEIAITDDALSSIAGLSAGGFRDAIGLLDQLSVLDDEITAATVGEFFGRVDDKSIAELLTMVEQNNLSKALETLSQLIHKGFRPVDMTSQLLEYVHSQLGINPDTMEFLARAGSELQQAMQDFKLHAHPSLPLELALVRMSQSQHSDKSTPVTQPESKQFTKAAVVSARPKEVKPTVNTPSTKVDDSKLLAKALSLVKQHNNSLYAVLRSAQLTMVGDELQAEFRFSFHRERMEEPRNRQLIEQCFSKVYEHSVTIKSTITSAPEPAGQPVDPAENSGELVSAAMAIFNGEVIDAQDQTK